MKTIAILLAAGRGERMGEGVPKQYRLLAGVPVLRHSLVKLLGAPSLVDRLAVVIQPEHEGFYLQAIDGLEGQERLLPAVHGANTRQDSVYAALQAIAPFSPQDVILHDAARPLTDISLFFAVKEALHNSKGAVCAYKITDTLKRVSGRMIEATVDRTGIYGAQTPQAFDFKTLIAAHEAACQALKRDFTDDAMLLEGQGHRIALVESAEDNLKLTVPADWRHATALLQTTSIRSAIGFDMHAFHEGDHVVLGGIRIRHNRGIKAHSDGDVVFHALTDALFGLLGEGDIGTHFPPAEPLWQNAESKVFVEHALARLRRRGGMLINCDVTVIAQAPHLGAHRQQICENIARLTSLPLPSVSLKATTAEGLGSIGRGEGLAALVAVSASLPVIP